MGELEQHVKYNTNRNAPRNNYYVVVVDAAI